MISAASMVYRVNIAISAEEDLERLYTWVAAQAPTRGPEWFKGNEKEKIVHVIHIRHGARRPISPKELGSDPWY